MNKTTIKRKGIEEEKVKSTGFNKRMETIIEGEGEENRSSKRKNDENVLIEKEYMYEYK